MGIPKFYRWISERYPCLSEIVKEYQIPEFDNLYLDMNGIIHTCSHPDDSNPHFRISEQQIFLDIFHYIEVLFRMIKPKQAFFMAVDGVAPRAKMNQQRSRRFRSAKEAEDLIAKALNKGENLPKDERFDSNCITPGTAFMARLHIALKDFVVAKVNSDPLWQIPTIIFSGHESPGEGEHKIMEYIRHEKSKATFNPNTRHCLYGLDADLIMLGLITHEPHFALLREEVKFTSNKKEKRLVSPEETTFHLLHLSLLRDYLNLEFNSLKVGKLKFEYDLEKIIDDWVFMGFLVGNDFVPNLPNIHIHQDCLPVLWSTYKFVLPTLEGYMNEDGILNLERFQQYIHELEKYDVEKFQQHSEDRKWIKNKSRNNQMNNTKRLKKLSDEDDDEEEEEDDDTERDEQRETSNDERKSLNSDLIGIPSASDFVSKGLNSLTEVSSIETSVSEVMFNVQNQSNSLNRMFREFKNNYYMEKMDIPVITEHLLEELAYEYVMALQWILHYYYNGVQSWSWFYPNHYAPFLSDLKHLRHYKLNYDLCTPFLPFQQLMAVLPRASKNLLPSAYQDLMDEDSVLGSYYPVDFKSDLNGKLQEWEAVVLIPFIDEKKLLEAMNQRSGRLTAEENKRNSFGPHIVFHYVNKPQKTYHMQNREVIHKNYAKLTELPPNALFVQIEKIRKGLCKGVDMTVYRFGFPTLQHLPHTGKLKPCGVKVFQRNSTNSSMIITLDQLKDDDLEMVGNLLLGHVIHVNYPHLVECLVTCISSDETRWKLIGGSPDNKGNILCEQLNPDEQALWHKISNDLIEKYMMRFAVDIENECLLIHGRTLVGKRYLVNKSGHVSLSKQWSKVTEIFLYQTSVLIPTLDFSTPGTQVTLNDLYPIGSCVFMLCNPHYGAQGHVMEISGASSPRITAKFTIPSEPNLDQFRNDIFKNPQSNYVPAHATCLHLGISPHLLSRITGTIFVVDDETSAKTNIGLNLKFNKQNMEVPGYTMKVNNEWLYSQKVCNILQDYISKFPDLFKEINCMANKDVFPISKIFKRDKEKRMENLKNYLNLLPCRMLDPKPHGTLELDTEMVNNIQQLVTAFSKKKQSTVVMMVRPHLLYQLRDLHSACVADESVTFKLLDRVVNVRQGYCVPIGLRGTLVGIVPGVKDQDYSYEILFDKPFPGGIKIKSDVENGYKVPSWALINISHGERLFQLHNQESMQKNNNYIPNMPQVKNSNNSSSAGYNEQRKKDLDEFGRIWKSMKMTKLESNNNIMPADKSPHNKHMYDVSHLNQFSLNTTTTQSALSKVTTPLNITSITGNISQMHINNTDVFVKKQTTLPDHVSTSSTPSSVPVPPTLKPPQNWINQSSNQLIHKSETETSKKFTFEDLLRNVKGCVALGQVSTHMNNDITSSRQTPTNTNQCNMNAGDRVSFTHQHAQPTSDQSIRHPPNQYINPPTNQSMDPSTHTSYQPLNQSIDSSVHNNQQTFQMPVMSQPPGPKQKELENMCMQMRLLPPQYEVMNVGVGHQARLLLSNGRHFVGSVAKDTHMAIESVSCIAMYNMQNRFVNPQQIVSTSGNYEKVQSRDKKAPNFVPTQVLRTQINKPTKEMNREVTKMSSGFIVTSEKPEPSQTLQTQRQTLNLKFVNKKHRKRIAANFEDLSASGN